MNCVGPPPVGGPFASEPVEDPQRIRLLVAYDGSAFHGFAENRDVPTVAGHLREALERVLRHPVTLACAGRTDAGVHARGQVVHLDSPVVEGRPVMDPSRLRDSVNGLLGPAIVVLDASVVPADFHARFSARSRTYHYLVLNRPVPDPFLASTSWWVPAPMDRAALADACPALLGEHDFSSFCRRPKGVEVSLVRRVLDAGWTEVDGEPGLLRFTITASAFCHQMVRSIVGLLVDVGRGRLEPSDVGVALEARDRSRVGSLAPPRGLMLWEVLY